MLSVVTVNAVRMNVVAPNVGHTFAINQIEEVETNYKI